MGALATSILTDPRLDSLDAETFRAFTRLACFVAQGGALDLAAAEKESRLGPLATARMLAALADAGLITEDSQGRLRLGDGSMSRFSASNEDEKSDTAPRTPPPPADGNVVAMPEPEKRRPMTRAERQRRCRARKRERAREQQLSFKFLIEGGGVRGSKDRPVTAARHDVTKSAVTSVTKNVTRRDISAAQSEISQSDQCGENPDVTKPAVTGVTNAENRPYIYSSSKELREDKYTADVTRHAARRDSRSRRRPSDFPPDILAVVDHCLPRWPPRQTENPSHKARIALESVWGADDNPQAVIAAFDRWSVSPATNKIKNTDFVPQAATWFRERRWEDWPPAAVPPPRKVSSPAPVIDPEAAADPRWRQFAELVSAAIGADQWESWFSRLAPIGDQDGVLRIAAATRFGATHVENNFGSQVRAAARAAYGAERVMVTGEPEALRAAQTKRVAAGARAPP